MPDWHALVRRELRDLALQDGQQNEVVAELAAHLEETCENLLRSGLSEDEAVRRTLLQAGDWKLLRRRIRTARSKESAMNDRVRQFWLPGILTFVLAEGLLGLFQKLGPRPLIFAWSGHPPVALFYMPWLLALPFIGGFGAYLSRRAGGSPRAVFSSVLFPVLAMLGLFVVTFPLVLVIDRRVDHHVQATVFLLVMLGWVLIPGAALLVGGLPTQLFLERYRTRPEAAQGG